MKVLTIKQPYIELILRGIKRLETRSWPTKHRGPLLLHSSSSRDENAISMCHQLGLLPKNHQFPTGQLLGIADVQECLNFKDTLAWLNKAFGAGNEILFGFYGPQYFSFDLTNVVRFSKPVKLKGQTGLWEYDADIEALV